MRVGCFKRTASKHVYYLGWNRSPVQVGCMRQALGPGALGKPRGSGWRGRWEGGSGWGTHVNPWLFHFNVWQNPLQIKIKKKKYWSGFPFPSPGDLPNPGTKPRSLTSPALAGGFFMTSATWKSAEYAQTFSNVLPIIPLSFKLIDTMIMSLTVHIKWLNC